MCEEDEDEYFISIFIENIDTPTQNTAWLSAVRVHGSRIKMKLDTGAGTNIIPMKTFQKLKKAPQPKPSSTTLRAFGGANVQHKGKEK